MDVGSTTPKSSCRQEKYKRNPNQWREKFRRGCIDRLHRSRKKVFEKMRRNTEDLEDTESLSTPEKLTKELANEIMMEELMHTEGDENCPCCSNRQLLSEDVPSSDINELLEVMEEIREELIREEQAILQQYNDYVKFDEDCLCAAINCLSTEKVICPVCQRYDLMQNKQVIFCECGVRIDTQYDGVTLSHIKNQVEYLVNLHGQLCADAPVFSQTSLDLVGLENLVMSCKGCDFLEIVV